MERLLILCIPEIKLHVYKELQFYGLVLVDMNKIKINIQKKL